MTLESSPHRVRFAPSPTGFLHVGGARTALFNWLFARTHGGAFLLRIEDTDKARSTEESTAAIFEGLQWLGLDWDEEVVYQAKGLAQHQRDAERMLASGTAYRCFCTPAELSEQRKVRGAGSDRFKYARWCDRLSEEDRAQRLNAGIPFVIRFRVPDGTTEWDDLVHERISFPNKDIEDFVILRSDATPIYNMAVVSDDITMGITLVMRGDDHISNTPKQILLYRALGVEAPRFAHVPMIHGTDGKKLSKRHGATAVADYQKEGILPSAMVNFLALLGWSPGGDREVMTLQEMTELFSADGLQKKAAVFDPKKLEWMNGQHLSRIGAAELAPIVTPMLVQSGMVSEAELTERREWYLALIDLLKIRARTTHDVVRQTRPYFAAEISYDPDSTAKSWKDADQTVTLLTFARERLAQLAEWRPDSMEGALRTLADEMGVPAGKVFQPLRVALTGMSVSPGIFDVLDAMGRDFAVARLGQAIDHIRAR